MLSFNMTAEIDCERSERSIFLLQMVSDTFAADHPMHCARRTCALYFIISTGTRIVSGEGAMETSK